MRNKTQIKRTAVRHELPADYVEWRKNCPVEQQLFQGKQNVSERKRRYKPLMRRVTSDDTEWYE